MLWRLFHHVCVHGAADRHKRENMAEGAVSIIKHFQGGALMIKLEVIECPSLLCAYKRRLMSMPRQIAVYSCSLDARGIS
jgi:hypothetical protein